MKVADTSFLFALFNPADQRHEAARNDMASQRVVVPTEIITELMGLMGHRMGRKAARQAFDALTEQPNVLLSGDLDARRAVALYRKHAGLSFVDACVVACCEGRGCGVLAYDEEIEGLVGE